MRLPPALRLIATAVLTFAATAALWWLVGYQIGKGVLSDTGGLLAFRLAYGFEAQAFLELLALALVAPVVREVWSGSGPPPWLALAGVAAGAALAFGDRGGSASISIAFFVFAAAAAAESSGPAQLVAALAGALLAALAHAAALHVGTGERILVVGLRAVFCYGPLLVGPTFADRLLDRARA